MNKTIKTIIDERQAVKAYSEKSISQSDWDQITDMIQWSPTAHGFEPYRVLVLKRGNPIRDVLKEATWGQSKTVTADKLVIFISLSKETFMDEEWVFKNTLRKATEILGLKGKEATEAAKKQADGILTNHFRKDEMDGDQWAMKQAYIGMTAGIIGASILGIGSTPMEGIDKQEIFNILKKNKLIEDNERIAVVVTFGYPESKAAYVHGGSGKRIRYPKETKFKEI